MLHLLAFHQDTDGRYFVAAVRVEWFRIQPVSIGLTTALNVSRGAESVSFIVPNSVGEINKNRLKEHLLNLIISLSGNEDRLPLGEKEILLTTGSDLIIDG